MIFLRFFDIASFTILTDAKLVQTVLMKANEESAHDDEQLLARISAGDRVAARLFVERHIAFVRRVCHKTLSNSALADEACQEVFLAVWRHAAKFNPGAAKVTTWLYRIAVNKSIDSRRRLKKAENIDDFHHLSSDHADAEAELAVQDDHRLIAAALKSLAPTQRQAIELVYFSELKQYEAADQMGLTLAAFESVLRRARQALHVELARERPYLSAI